MAKKLPAKKKVKVEPDVSKRLKQDMKTLSNRHSKKLKPPKSNWDFYEDGISYSLMSKHIVCPERFRIYACEGLRPSDRKEAMEFGTIFHKALEYAAQGNTTTQIVSRLMKWGQISKADMMLCRIAATMVPHYRKFYQDDKHKYVSTEQVFKNPYKLSNGRITYLRGRMDEVYVKNGGLWLQENKTKSRIDEDKIIATLPSDLQTMFYVYNMSLIYDRRIDGVMYNVIRKPELKQRTKEGDIAFLKRINEDILERPEHYFKRYEVELVKKDIDDFHEKVIAPTLERIMIWWESIKNNPFDPWHLPDGRVNPHHWLRPFGVFDPMSLGRGDYFDYVTSGSTMGLEKIDSPFPELANEEQGLS
jgi:hypothetical protein